MTDNAGYELPPRPKRTNGEIRRVGFELEFSGIDLKTAVAAIRSVRGATVVAETAAEVTLEAGELGTFTIEIDWNFLKRMAADGDEPEGRDWVEPLSQAATLLVPIEMVCPPIPITSLAELDPMLDALREAGAVGTEESLIAAYGVHINAEIPDLDASTLSAYIKAYSLLQWWLMDRQPVDLTRRISPYIDLYSEAYLRQVLSRPEPTMEDICRDYLEHNATRNRALDLLPLLAEIDEARVKRVIDDPRIKGRAAFHYRLPDCHIEQDDWSLRLPWKTWLVVERLAARRDDLEQLAESFLEADRPLLGVKRSDWVELMDRWLHDRGLA